MECLPTVREWQIVSQKEAAVKRMYLIFIKNCENYLRGEYIPFTNQVN